MVHTQLLLNFEFVSVGAKNLRLAAETSLIVNKSLKIESLKSVDVD